MVPKKILCPIDFSPGSQQAMRVAIRIASEADAELVLGHAWYVPPVAFSGEYAFSQAVLEELEGDARAALDSATREATALGAKRLTSKLLAGMPRHEIAKLLEHDPAFDLVVMGTHGRTGLTRVLLGSVAESVVRHAPCSVLVVRPDGEAKRFTHVLCPIDFSDSSRHAVEVAVGLVQPARGAITLLHVIDPPTRFARREQTLELLSELDRYSTEHLDAWAAQLESRVSSPVRKLARTGWPGAEILAALDEDPAVDLVVMGSHGRAGMERMLLGSVAEKVVRHARCPVLVARRRPEPR
jgi:nucleotide-binding universal stress UspA family protein